MNDGGKNPQLVMVCQEISDTHLFHCLRLGNGASTLRIHEKNKETLGMCTVCVCVCGFYSDCFLSSGGARKVYLNNHDSKCAAINKEAEDQRARIYLPTQIGILTFIIAWQAYLHVSDSLQKSSCDTGLGQCEDVHVGVSQDVQNKSKRLHGEKWV